MSGWENIGVCVSCRGEGYLRSPEGRMRGSKLGGLPGCGVCDGHGLIGVDPARPTGFPPGSDAKVAVLGARYLSGMPLWNPHDEHETFAGKLGSGGSRSKGRLAAGGVPLDNGF